MNQNHVIKITTLFLVFLSMLANAQNAANITLKTAAPQTATASLVLEDVHFYPNLGIGLTDTHMEPLSVVDFKEIPSEKITASLKSPKMMRLRYSGNGVNKTYMVFAQPGDNLTATFTEKGEVSFAGTTAPYQEFLRKYFMENQYQYLPVFGYKPYQIDNNVVNRQSDSLRTLRETAYTAFKAENPPVPAFDAYVTATTRTEPYLIRRLIQEKIMRRSMAVKLDPAQRKAFEDFTLNDFKILSDDALLSQSYREELRNWVLIPSIRKFPLDSATRYEISPAALGDVFQFSEQKLQGFPAQKEYILTYWLNYAATAIPTVETSQNMLEDYKAALPKSTYIDYFTQLISTKEKLEPGTIIPEVTLLDRDSVSHSLYEFIGKPICIVFAFNLRQHEPTLKAFETKYNSHVTFLYVNVYEGMSFTFWKKYAEDRDGVKHLWASDANINLLKKEYAIDIRYPFLVVDSSGKIVNRWIPQEFPNNLALQTEIDKTNIR